MTLSGGLSAPASFAGGGGSTSSTSSPTSTSTSSDDEDDSPIWEGDNGNAELAQDPVEEMEQRNEEIHEQIEDGEDAGLEAALDEPAVWIAVGIVLLILWVIF